VTASVEPLLKYRKLYIMDTGAKSEIAALNDEIAALNDEIAALKADADADADTTQPSTSDVIENIVDRFLHSEFTNNPLIPDFIERRLYRNVVKLIIVILKETLETANVDVLGHRIIFSLEPHDKKGPTV